MKIDKQENHQKILYHLSLLNEDMILCPTIYSLWWLHLNVQLSWTSELATGACTVNDSYVAT